MGIRQTLQRQPKIAIAVSGILVVAALFLALLELRGLNTAVPNQGFFSTDDGATWFKDDIRKAPPFLVDGKEADRAYVFKCGGKEFVGYLERFTPWGLKYIVSSGQSLQEVSSSNSVKGITPGCSSEAKKPGEKQWIPSNDYIKLGKVCTVDCPDGGTPERVAP